MILPVKPLSSKSAADPDEYSLALLTQEMENLVIENRLSTVPAASDLGRVRDMVIKRVKAKAKAQVHEKPGPRRRAFSQRSIGSIQLQSQALRPFGDSTNVEVIDVDALPDAECRVKQEYLGRKEQRNLRSEAGQTLATCLRARSKSC